MFTPSDAPKRARSEAQQARWASVANAVYLRCVKRGADNSECDASAVTQANRTLLRYSAAECEDWYTMKLQEMTKTIGDVAHDIVEDPEVVETWSLDEAREKLKALYDSEGLDQPVAEAALADMRDEALASVPAQLVYLFAEAARSLVMSGGDNAMGQLEMLASEFVELMKEALGATPEPEQEPEPEVEASELDESAVFSVPEQIAESADGVLPGRSPVTIDLQVITPGPGNKRQRNYYPPDMLREYAGVFEGVDVFMTDHKESERGERTKVGIVKKLARFSEAGAPIYTTVIYDPDTAEKIRNRALAGELGTLHCSILASGESRKGKIDGVEYNIVERITEARSVDLVSKAGAGGKALNISEADVEITELDDSVVAKAVAATALPVASKARLTEASYCSEAELSEAIAKEIEYVKEITGSGKPFAVGVTTGKRDKLAEVDLAERGDIRWKSIMKQIGREV